MRRDEVKEAIERERAMWGTGPRSAGALSALDAVEKRLGLDTLTLPGPALGRKPTSRTAADLAAPKVGSQAEAVLLILMDCVPLTDESIFEKRPITLDDVRQSTIRARRIGLVEGGWVREIDQNGKTKSGRTAIRWGLTGEAVERLFSPAHISTKQGGRNGAS